MVKPGSSQQSKAVQELVASVRSNVEVIKDALKAPATEDSHAVVSDLMLEVKQSQDKLQKKAEELADTGEFDNTNEIFEAIDQVTQLEPEYENWSKLISAPDSGAPNADMIGSSIHVEEEAVDTGIKQKKKKKKKRKDNIESSGFDAANSGGGWEAFPPPPGAASGSSWPVTQSVPVPVVVDSAEQTPEPVSAQPSSAKGRITLGMTWDMIGPLLGDPGSSDEERKARLGELMKEAIASECGISQSRINIIQISYLNHECLLTVQNQSIVLLHPYVVI
jgi:hypothetical protein